MSALKNLAISGNILDSESHGDNTIGIMWSFHHTNEKQVKTTRTRLESTCTNSKLLSGDLSVVKSPERKFLSVLNSHKPINSKGKSQFCQFSLSNFEGITEMSGQTEEKPRLGINLKAKLERIPANAGDNCFTDLDVEDRLVFILKEDPGTCLSVDSALEVLMNASLLECGSEEC